MPDLGTTVFSYILPSNRAALDYAIERLTIDHFRDGIQRTFWSVLSRFAERYNDVFPEKHLVDLLTRYGVEPTKTLLFAETYKSYVSAEVSESAFRFAVDGLREDRDSFETGVAITTAFDILENGKEIDGEFVHGHQAARQYLYVHAGEIDQRSVVEEAPEGDLRAEGDRLLALYQARAGQEDTTGITFGISSVDGSTNGVQPGELVLIAAFTSEGKSQLLAQLAWDACVKQGKNVFFATSETVRDTTMRRILTRHSRQPQFGCPEGLNAKAVQNGTLSPAHFEVYRAVLDDFSTNPDIGLCHISQLPSNATLGFVDQRARRVNRTHRIDLVLIDYLQLLKAEVRRSTEREEYNELLRRTKTWAPAFDNGRGIPVVSPWQMSREAYKAAVQANAYSPASLSDTSEAEKSSDLILSLLRPNPDAREAVLQILKNRDGPLLAPTGVHLDYRCSYIGETANAVPEAAGSFGNDGAFDLLSVDSSAFL